MAGESLKVVAGNATGSSIALDAELVIGRSTPGLGSLGGDSEISRVHARIYHDPSGQLMVEDLGSTNGTFVNGARIGGAQALRGGDQVRVGQSTMTVEGGAGEGATTVGQVISPAAAAVPPPPAAAAATPPTQPFQPAQPPQAPPPGGQQPGYAGGPIGGPPGRAAGSSKAPWIALAAVVLIALIVAGLAIGGVFSSDSKKNVANTTPTAAAPPPAPATPPPTAAMPPPPAAMPPPPSNPTSGNGWPPGIIPKLAARCAASGKLTRSQCTCTFTTLRNQYTFPEFIVALKKTQAGSPPAPVVNAIRKCLSA
jgi:predicted component of type VI protein secretion system